MSLLGAVEIGADQRRGAGIEVGPVADHESLGRDLGLLPEFLRPGNNVTPRTQRTTDRTQSSRAGQSSQVSAASSQPESQLPATQTESQESQGITPARLQVFQTALGQLIDGPLFANDAADVEPLVAAVNARLGGGNGREAFDEDEAEKALEALSERNKIMYSGGIVYKI